jgi:hypothetical protein
LDSSNYGGQTLYKICLEQRMIANKKGGLGPPFL